MCNLKQTKNVPFQMKDCWGEMELLNLKTRQICFGLVARGARDGDGRPIGWPTDAVNPRGPREVSFELTKLGANFGAGVKLKHEP